MDAPVHLILDGAHSGKWNMAVDELLLEESLQTGTTFLRLYRWAEPTVSLGYFQKEDERLRDPRLAELPYVRRLTGGGAILHHHEQTYSLCLPPHHPLCREPSRAYAEAHAAFAAWLTSFGVAVAPRGTRPPPPREPFLCFLREASVDLVVNGHKVLGSAQRRRRGAILQHGSLLLRASIFTPELLGLHELVPGLSGPETSIIDLASRLADRVGSTVSIQDLPARVRRQANERVSTGTCPPQVPRIARLSESP